MGARRFVIGTFVVLPLVFSGCATSPEDEYRQREMEADIDEILSYELDISEYGDIRSCLPDAEYRRYRALGDRHLLFVGRRGMQWVNVLRGRCPGLDENSTFILEKNMGNRVCDKDQFNIMDSFGSANMGRTCILGMFKPVTKEQVTEIENRLEMR